MLVQVQKVKTIRELTNDPDAITPTEWDRRMAEREARLSDTWHKMGPAIPGLGIGGAKGRRVIDLDSGAKFGSISDAARVLDIPQGTVYACIYNRTLCRGRRLVFDTAEGRATVFRKPRTIPVYVGGIRYDHANAAARANGVTPMAVRHALRSGKRMKGMRVALAETADSEVA